MASSTEKKWKGKGRRGGGCRFKELIYYLEGGNKGNRARVHPFVGGKGGGGRRRTRDPLFFLRASL